MKLKNIFKKKTITVAKANVEALDKKQLEKVIGGQEKGDKSDGLSADTSIDQQRIRALDGNPTL